MRDQKKDHIPIEMISDKNIIVGPNHLTRFERARIVGARALQLSLGAPILIQAETFEGKSPLVIAEFELRSKVLPISIKRERPSRDFQIISIQKLRDIQALREF